MNYIVFDLEWNQNPDRNAPPNKLLPFEIIEIGAVKLDEARNEIDSFHQLIRPSVYHWLQDTIRQVTHMHMSDLRKGKPFPDACDDFLRWCGSDYRFCTWAKQDLTELQRNMRYYHMLDLLPGPVVYYDVQKLVSYRFLDGRDRPSLEHTIDLLQLPKDQGFHRALQDASYTARIFRQIEESYLTGYESVDAFQHPVNKGAEFTYSSGNRVKYISHEFGNRDRAWNDKRVRSVYCPVCSLPTFREGEAGNSRVQWLPGNTRVNYCLSYCLEHGAVAGRLRLKKTDEEKYIAVKTLWLLADEEEEAQMKEYLETLREKKGKKL
ncbi:MAG: exonuclease domain-containing protein [Blautia sp.]|nr:exonuclease domain-containing protein [Blautia sp.]